jgi:hypothetical protein
MKLDEVEPRAFHGRHKKHDSPEPKTQKLDGSRTQNVFLIMAARSFIWFGRLSMQICVHRCHARTRRLKEGWLSESSVWLSRVFATYLDRTEDDVMNAPARIARSAHDLTERRLMKGEKHGLTDSGRNGRTTLKLLCLLSPRYFIYVRTLPT